MAVRSIYLLFLNLLHTHQSVKYGDLAINGKSKITGMYTVICVLFKKQHFATILKQCTLGHGTNSEPRSSSPSS